MTDPEGPKLSEFQFVGVMALIFPLAIILPSLVFLVPVSGPIGAGLVFMMLFKGVLPVFGAAGFIHGICIVFLRRHWDYAHSCNRWTFWAAVGSASGCLSTAIALICSSIIISLSFHRPMFLGISKSLATPCLVGTIEGAIFAAWFVRFLA
jgi:hypothetical protein